MLRVAECVIIMSTSAVNLISRGYTGFGMFTASANPGSYVGPSTVLPKYFSPFYSYSNPLWARFIVYY